ncbi:MAG: PPOX class F420-dependent oxidoreductase [Actinomycetota bacterium]|nr:PPOX class F420-dependent oxidoreductase [Actinomycetota bacterium]
MRTMSDDEVREFLSHGTRTGKVAWVASDGRPHVTPIWFVLDGDDLVFNTHESAGKAKAMGRDGRVSLVVDDETPPFSYVKIDGTVSFGTDPDELRAVATRIGGRYMGPDRAEEFGRRNGVPGELIVRLTPTRITAHADLAD